MKQDYCGDETIWRCHQEERLAEKRCKCFEKKIERDSQLKMAVWAKMSKPIQKEYLIRVLLKCICLKI